MQLVRTSDTKQALGGDVTISIVTAKEDVRMVERELPKLWRDILLFEKRFSRFLPSSELTRFNQKAGTRTPVSSEFQAVLEKVNELIEMTEGRFNPFILPALQRAGYKQSAVEKYQSDTAPDYTNRHTALSTQVEIGEDFALIPYNSALDLGGMGKGYLADDIASKLQMLPGVKGYWIEMSGDIATFGVDENNQPIHIAVQAANDPTTTNSEVSIVCPKEPFGVATSGTFRRNTQTGELVHHIIDPRTGKSADTDVVLATVCASSALLADVLASCAVIEGSSAATEFLRSHAVDSWVIQYYSESGSLMQTVEGPHAIKGDSKQ